MGWSSDASFKNAKKAPPCRPCAHYEREEKSAGDSRHRCELVRPEFPRGGGRCRAYLYQPGADADEAYL